MKFVVLFLVMIVCGNVLAQVVPSLVTKPRTKSDNSPMTSKLNWSCSVSCATLATVVEVINGKDVNVPIVTASGVVLMNQITGDDLKKTTSTVLCPSLFSTHGPKVKAADKKLTSASCQEL